MIDAPLDWVRVESTWSADLADLSVPAFGAHIRLILVSARRGPLPADRAALARLCGASNRDFARCWAEIAPLWQEANGSITNAYVETERQRLRSAREALRAAGRRGAERRWRERDESNGQPNGQPNGLANSQSMASDGELEKDPRDLDEEFEDEESEISGAARRPSVAGNRRIHRLRVDQLELENAERIALIKAERRRG